MKTRLGVLAVLAAVVATEAAATARAPVQGPGTAASLSVSNGLPRLANGGAAPMSMMLLRDSVEVLLRKNGTSLAAWVDACVTGRAACKNSLSVLEPAFAGAAITDLNGRATFAAVPAGRYFVFAQAAYNNRLLVWDSRVDLQPGANAITLDQRNIAPLNAQPPGTPVAGAATPGGAAAAAGAQQAIDPSIAKARAAKVDTMVFGIPLGEPLKLPECDPLQLGSTLSVEPGAPTGFTVAATCIYEVPLGGLVAALLPFKIEGAAAGETITIMLAGDRCPAWLVSCAAAGVLNDGLLVAVEMTTRGRAVDQAVSKELRGKYGQRLLATEGTVRPTTGETFDVTTLEWILPGLHVEYSPVLRSGSEVTDYTKGFVRIETETVYQRRRAREQEQAKPRL